MAEVFRLLDFKVCDWEETMLDCADLWLEFYKGEKSHVERINILREMLEDFDACMGAPCYDEFVKQRL